MKCIVELSSKWHYKMQVMKLCSSSAAVLRCCCAVVIISHLISTTFIKTEPVDHLVDEFMYAIVIAIVWSLKVNYFRQPNWYHFRFSILAILSVPRWNVDAFVVVLFNLIFRVFAYVFYRIFFISSNNWLISDWNTLNSEIWC